MTSTIIILGQHVFLPSRDSESWDAVKFEQVEQSAKDIVSTIVAADPGKRVRLIYDPASLVSDEVEIAKADRETLRQIPELRENHAALASDHLGWGFQEHWNSGAGPRTILHSESAAGLIGLLDRLAQIPIKVEGAWPATSLAFGRGGAGTTSVFMMLAQEEAFLYIESKGQRIPYKFSGGVGSMDRDFWTDLKARLETQYILTNTAANALVLSNVGDADAIAEMCPWWKAWSSTARVKVESFEGAARIASKLSPRSPANLTGAFPQPFDFTPVTKAVTAACVLYAVVYGGFNARQIHAAHVDEEAKKVSYSAGSTRLAAAQGRKNRIEQLKAKYGEDVAVAPSSRQALLVQVADSLSSNLSINEFNVTPEGAVRITGVAWQVTADANRGQVLDPVLKRLQVGLPDFTIESDKTNYDSEKRVWVIVGALNRKAASAQQQNQGEK